MTVLSVFDFRKFLIYGSDVKKLLVIIVILSILDTIPSINGSSLNYREPRKFGGYRITPTYCKASRSAKYNRGNTICMFNHECFQRGGEVVGACMDGFLFGACCQLKSDSQSHIPKGPGVVMTSYLDYPDPEQEEDFNEGDELNAWHNSFKPIVTPGYRPTEKYQFSTKAPESSSPSFSSTQSLSAEIISEGVSQITSTLLHSPNNDNFIYIKPGQDSGVYTQSTINHNGAETYLVNKNGSPVDNVARPSDFNIFISSIQTKPAIVLSTTTTTEAPKTSSTHRPVYSKPVFKPKPVSKPSIKPIVTKKPIKPSLNKISSTTEKYIMVSTVTKDVQKITELSSMQSPAITTIIQMLNESTPSINREETSTQPSVTLSIENKSSPTPTSTISPVSYSSGYPNYYLSTGHYVTLKPSATSNTVSIFSNTPSYSSTTKRPSTYYNKFTTSPNSIQEVQVTSNKPYYSSPSPTQSTSQINSFNIYPTNPNDFDNSVTTFSYVSSSTTRRPVTTTTRKPPSTSYVFGTKPSKRPATSSSSNLNTYDIAPDNFASVTPTVIVLNGFTAKPETTQALEPQFVEISQEPFKKPINQITVNNNIQSTNNIYVGKPSSSNTKPTVVITPKPSPNTTPSSPIHTTTGVAYVSYTDIVYSPTTIKPEIYTSPDDLINFPPVRNPLLNATGSNPSLYTNGSILTENELDVLHDVEFTTPSFLLEDENLKNKMDLFVNKIVGSLKGTFQELHDIVILDKKPNATIINSKTTTAKPPKKPLLTTRRPATTTRKPIRLTTRKPKPTVKPTTTKKPVKLTTAIRRPTTTNPPPTTTKRAVTTTKKPKPTKRVTTTTARITTTTEFEEVTTEEYQDSSIDYSNKNLCGVRPMVKSGRIVGGKNAKFGAFPWQVLVRETTWLGLFTKNKCGGVLITNRYVTTAAHCQPGFLASLVVAFGENDIAMDLEPKRPVSRNVKRVIVHRDYNAATFENDLAVLEMESTIKFEPHIVPICMPPDEADFTDRMATVTGWGRLKYGGGVPAVLQEVQVPVIENSVCQEMFQKAGHTKIILNSFLCAGYVNGQKDSCEGDSGGPLVLQRDDGRWQLVGTVSHGIKCAAPYLPGVYMRATYYKPWIKSITGVH